MQIYTCDIKLNTFKIFMQKSVKITSTTIYPGFLLVLRYQHQVIELTRLRTVQILLLDRFTWMKYMWNTACKTPLPKTKWLFHGTNFVMSTLQYIILLRETYKLQTRKCIVDTVPTNRCPMCSTNFYVNCRTNLKCKIYFLEWWRISKIIHNEPVP